MSKVVLTLSGGLDSAVLLYHLHKLRDEVRCLSVDYGQRHRRELLAAAAICRGLNVEHKVVDLTSVRQLMLGSSQTDWNVEVPEGHYAEESMKQTVVPNRNMILLALAGAWAVSTKSNSIAYAAHAGDHAIYPDCRPDFVTALSHAFMFADWHRVRLVRPFLLLTKAEVVKMGQGLSVPFELTYSCYKGNEHHCGRCGTCVERQEAFAVAQVMDPTIYATS